MDQLQGCAWLGRRRTRVRACHRLEVVGGRELGWLARLWSRPIGGRWARQLSKAVGQGVHPLSELSPGGLEAVDTEHAAAVDTEHDAAVDIEHAAAVDIEHAAAFPPSLGLCLSPAAAGADLPKCEALASLCFTFGLPVASP